MRAKQMCSSVAMHNPSMHEALTLSEDQGEVGMKRDDLVFLPRMLHPAHPTVFWVHNGSSYSSGWCSRG